MIWYWEPYHRPALSALKVFKDPEHVLKALENISVVEAPPWLKKRNPELVGPLGELTILDPTARVQRTLQLASQPDFEVQTVEQFKQRWGQSRVPVVDNMEEFRELKKIWTPYPKLWARFGNSNPWQQFEILEQLFGLTKSHTVLEFKRIDGTHNIP